MRIPPALSNDIGDMRALTKTLSAQLDSLERAPHSHHAVDFMESILGRLHHTLQSIHSNQQLVSRLGPNEAENGEGWIYTRPQ